MSSTWSKAQADSQVSGLIDHLRQVIQNSSNSLIPNGLNQVTILVFSPKYSVVLYATSSEPMPCIGVDVIQSKIRSCSTDPHFGASSSHIHSKLPSSLIDRHTALEAALSIGKLGRAIGGLADPHVLGEALARVNIAWVWHLSADVSLREAKEMQVIVAQRPVDIKCNNWLAVIEGGVFTTRTRHHA